MNQLERKTVIISGAAGGLGLESIRLLLQKGFFVIATDINTGPLEKFSREPGFRFVRWDATDPDGLKKIIEEFDLETEGVDLLVSLAGIYETFPVTEANPEKLAGMMAVNFNGTVNCVQGLLKALIKKRGRIVVISSESYRIQAMFQPYMITKAALEAYCRAARQELSLQGISLSVIRPGAIDTPLLRWMDSDKFTEEYPLYKKELRTAWKLSLSMVGRKSSSAEVASVILKAASSKNPARIYRVNNNLLLKLVMLLPDNLIERLMVRLIRDRSRK